jgi:uncharacterized protein YvpB
VDLFSEEEKLQPATARFRNFFSEQRQWTTNFNSNLAALYNDDQSPEMELLQNSFSWGEIATVIHKGQPSKIPGPDGFTNEFYKVFRNELVELFKSFHGDTVDLTGLNSAFITVLPKSDTPLQLTDYHPVSLQQ